MDHSLDIQRRLGQVIADKYQLLRVLGTGGRGVVYEAVHSVTQRHVAVKLMDPALPGAAPAAGARFLREAQAASSIGHSAIVDVLDAGKLEDNSLYLVFELLEGEDLERALQRGIVSPAHLVEICISVLDALAAAHAHGFIHRDIKPANIFLAREHEDSAEFEVKVLDFGVAKRVGQGAGNSITELGLIIGTLDYMSPEQALGDQVDPRADIWSVGALLFRGLAGVPLFTAGNPFELLKKILTAPIPSLRSHRGDLPESLITVVERALVRNVTARWTSAEEMRSALACCRLPEPHDDATERVALPEPYVDPTTGEHAEWLDSTDCEAYEDETVHAPEQQVAEPPRPPQRKG